MDMVRSPRSAGPLCPWRDRTTSMDMIDPSTWGRHPGHNYSQNVSSGTVHLLTTQVCVVSVQFWLLTLHPTW